MPKLTSSICDCRGSWCGWQIMWFHLLVTIVKTERCRWECSYFFIVLAFVLVKWEGCLSLAHAVNGFYPVASVYAMLRYPGWVEASYIVHRPGSAHTWIKRFMKVMNEAVVSYRILVSSITTSKTVEDTRYGVYKSFSRSLSLHDYKAHGVDETGSPSSEWPVAGPGSTPLTGQL